MGETPKPGVLMTDPRLADFSAALADSFTLIDGSMRAPDADEAASIVAILCAGSEPIDATLMDRLPSLRLIASPATGIDGVDLAAARARGVIVTNGASLQAEDVADHAVGMMLAARLRLSARDDEVRSGRWREQKVMAPRSAIYTQRVGIVGMGHIGQAVARRIAPFGAEIGWWAPRPKDLPWPRHESLLALANWSSVLILCARGDPADAGMIDAEVIDAIGPDGLIVNVARGFLVDEDALIAALKAGRLGQAALDVFVEEPTDPARWRDVPNTLLSPHVAAFSHEAFATLAALIVGNVRGLLTGAEPRNIVQDGRAGSAA